MAVYVVPRTGYVDRNESMLASKTVTVVVPRTGYVDRNYSEEVVKRGHATVVPRTGYVDRN